MKTSRLSLSGIAAGAALVVVLSACGSESSEPSAASSAPSTTSCPTAAPDDTSDPQWTLDGDTGSIAVTGSTDSTTPSVQVETPFSVSETQVHTLSEGSGPVVEDTAQVAVCYMGVNGRDGSVFDSSYQRGTPAEFPLTGVVTGFQKAIAGQTVGSKVAVAMTSADGYPDGQPRAGIEAGDSLVFVIDILDVTG